VGTLREEKSFREYTVRVYRDEEKGDGSFEILRNGRQIYAQHGWVFDVGYLNWWGKGKSAEGYAYQNENEHLVSMGKDITGDGKANLVVSEWTGGMHCAYLSYIFQIDAEFRQVAAVNGLHSEPRFEDLDRDGKLEILLDDWTFAYWWTCFADSPAPRVILRYCSGAYKPATDLMRKPAPTQREMEEHLHRVRKGEGWAEKNGYYETTPPSHLWGYMLDLIYSGNAVSAWKFLDRAWPQSMAGKDEFVRAFKEQLATSEYWPEIEAMNLE
jgi:hypothetical protein